MARLPHLLPLSLIAVLLLPGAALADRHVRDVRLWTAPDHTRVVFDLDERVDYRLFRLHDPERVVVDIDRARLDATLESLPLPDPVIEAIRHGRPESDVLRVVFDVKEQVRPRSFLLKPMHGKPFRLVVDLMREQEREIRTPRAAGESRAVTIAVDAGHGGEDPGAIGPHGVYEKDITLAVAKKLVAAINARDGMRAVLTRKGDYFVPLKKRYALARRARAELMISVHADAVRDRRVRGASVYTLSERGATPDRVAEALAARENASDAVGGFVVDEVEDPVVRGILGDMGKRESLNSAQILAQQIIGRLGAIGPVKYTEPKRARFVVLKALEIPSVLVELDYISNPSRERLLRADGHQRKLARALASASESFLRRQGRLRDAEPARTYTVRPGDSLWGIARRYGVSVSDLRAVNALSSTELRVGQTLKLPRT